MDGKHPPGYPSQLYSTETTVWITRFIRLYLLLLSANHIPNPEEKIIPWQHQDEESDDFVNLLTGVWSQKTDLVLSSLPSCQCGLGINSSCFIYHQNFQSTAKTERHIFPL